MYITGIIQNHKHKLLSIYAMPDHIHIFIGYNVNHLIPSLVEEIKTSSNAFIEQKKFLRVKFEWQRGYGAFTVSHSQIDQVAKYVVNQQDHHSKRSFREEYLDLLIKNEIEYKDEYLFNFFDDSALMK
jgi:putative transposase